MKKRNLRWLLASVVAVVSIGAGVSAASSDAATETDEAAIEITVAEKGSITRLPFRALRAFGIRW